MLRRLTMKLALTTLALTLALVPCAQARGLSATDASAEAMLTASAVAASPRITALVNRCYETADGRTLCLDDASVDVRPCRAVSSRRRRCAVYIRRGAGWHGPRVATAMITVQRHVSGRITSSWHWRDS